MLLLAACSPNTNPDVETLDGLSSGQKQTLSAFLSENKSFRPATDRDCDCNADINEIRLKGVWEKPMPGYHPYLRLEDFNHDGKDDLAIVLIAKDRAKRLVTVFNGPFPALPAHPALEHEVGVRDVLAYGPPPDHQLIIGPLYSEGCFLVAKGTAYSLDCDYGG
jgi:hypothetical protein